MSDEFVKPIHVAFIGGQYAYIPYNDVIESLQVSLRSVSTEKPATGTYNIRSAQLQTIFDNFYTSTLSSYSPLIQTYFAYRFIALGTVEEKKIGTMVLAKNLDEFTVDFIIDFERIFDNDITTWEICDGFATRVLGPLIKKSDDFAMKISVWKDSGKVWRMRASCVTFVSLAKVGAMTTLSFEICAACVKSSERFVQLGVGCLLREMSLTFSPQVVQFITENYRFFSREGLRYSIDKLDTVTRKQILAMGKKRNNKETIPVVSQSQQRKETKPKPLEKQNVVQVQNVQQVQPIQMNYGYPQPVYLVNYYPKDDNIYEVQQIPQQIQEQQHVLIPNSCQKPISSSSVQNSSV
ncbi:hypothetical protein EIN_283830 [Entamoeba invadens IP1]|uniref:Uncharacterized protein n=1 Tax=Entamoeba invadens IP1 TaxID=370355 RepID=L7FKB0_ENTIV|nr:hypothetical protein EIN_283830 [Entamoeba invadens IP1]ELP84837.1 hypothetical protein EIN_283830 [Entamoeba invadens IP1]|eukprot:XP_004184183.1 hypothetical protein EIN_283830 [Entamoeba invadens IP1]